MLESKFTGKVSKIFLWNLLIVLTVFIPILGGWVRFRKQRWIIEQSIYDGKQLDFTGTFGEYIGKRILWIILTAITLGIYGIWAVKNKYAWWIKSTIVRGASNTEKTEFVGSAFKLFLISLATVLVSILTLGLASPYMICVLNRWTARNTILLGKRLVFTGKALSLLGKYMLGILLTVITVGIYSFWFERSLIAWRVSNTHFVEQEQSETSVEQEDNAYTQV